ncbi:MAG: uracil-DNA glycosylase [Methylococcales bacterium]|nr:uracil-DNA glycosylase [Methylococcales bacterium]
MDNITRLQYLEAMGIDVWVPRVEDDVGVFVPDASELLEAETDLIGSVVPANDWQSLEQAVAQCSKCGLCDARTHAILGEGNQHADWMLIGDAPNDEEDLAGQFFAGASSQLLVEMIRAIGQERSSIYFTTALKCKIPEHKNPKVDEVKACQNYLRQQIEWVNPTVILAMGRVAAQTLLATHEPLAKLRGIVHHVYEKPIVVTYHPDYLLRSLSEKRKAWCDLQLAIKQNKNKK